MAAPAGEVHGVERDVGSIVGWLVGEEFGGVVEGSEAGGVVAVGGEGFAVGGGEPGLQGAWCGGLGRGVERGRGGRRRRGWLRCR